MTLSRRILGFNGTRGLCVIFVFLQHKCGFEFYLARIGVWTFLALSGFLLIPELYSQRILVESGSSTEFKEVGKFWFKRATRIFPVYYALLIFLFIFRGSLSSWAGSDLGFRYHFFFLSNFFFPFVAPADSLGSPFGVLWTLAVEQQFYFVAPLIFLLLPSRHHIGFCIIAAIFCGVGHVWLSVSGVEQNAIYLLSPWNFAIILIGGAAGLICRRSKPDPSALWTILSLTAIVGFSLSSLSQWAQGDLVYAMLTMAVAVAIAGLLASIYRDQSGPLTTALEWAPLEVLGQISYGFYLFHNFIPNPLGKVLLIAFGSQPPAILKVTIGAAIGFALATGAAYLSWTFFEKPIIQLRSRFLKARVIAMAK